MSRDRRGTRVVKRSRRAQRKLRPRVDLGEEILIVWKTGSAESSRTYLIRIQSELPTPGVRRSYDLRRLLVSTTSIWRASGSVKNMRPCFVLSYRYRCRLDYDCPWLSCLKISDNNSNALGALVPRALAQSASQPSHFLSEARSVRPPEHVLCRACPMSGTCSPAATSS